MTVKELSQLYHLNREIELDKRRLAELEAAAAGSTAGITGLPHIACLSDKAELAAVIAEIKEMIEAKAKLCVIEYNRLMRTITDIDDSFMRQILTFRYVNGLSWSQVAMHMGGGNTEDGVRMAHNRFLRKWKSGSFCSLNL